MGGQCPQGSLSSKTRTDAEGVGGDPQDPSALGHVSTGTMGSPSVPTALGDLMMVGGDKSVPESLSQL